MADLDGSIQNGEDGPEQGPVAVASAHGLEPPARHPRPFASRAAIVFKIFAVLGLVGLLAVPAVLGSPGEGTYKAAALGSMVALIAIAIVEAVGLDRRRPWAVAAAAPLLVLNVIVSSATTLIGIVQGRLVIPLDVLLVVWAFLGAREAGTASALGRRGTAVLATYLAGSIATYAIGPALAPGGFLDVQRDDLQGSIQVECGSREAGPPATIDVSYAWQWSRTTPFPSGLDEVEVLWTGQDGDGQALYVLGDLSPDSAVGVYAGLEGDPSAGMAQDIRQGASGSAAWGVDLAEQRLASGRVSLQLVRAAAGIPPSPGPLLVQVAYIHLGVWRNDLAEGTCSW